MAVLTSGMARAEALACPRPAPPDLRVRIVDAPVEIDRSHSKDDLTRLAADPSQSIVSQPTIETRGFTQARVLFRLSLDYHVLTAKDGRQCAWIAGGEITLTLDARIFVASDYPESSCAFRETLAHERKHADAEVALLKRKAGELRRMFNDQIIAMGAVGPVAPGGAEQAKLTLRQGLDQVAAPAIRAMDADRAEMHRRIDTVQEYTRLNLICRDW